MPVCGFVGTVLASAPWPARVRGPHCFLMQQRLGFVPARLAGSCECRDPHPLKEQPQPPGTLPDAGSRSDLCWGGKLRPEAQGRLLYSDLSRPILHLQRVKEELGMVC